LKKGLKQATKKNRLLIDAKGRFAIENLKNLHHERKREKGDILKNESKSICVPESYLRSADETMK